MEQSAHDAPRCLGLAVWAGVEDRREAATIYTSISTYVATATLALVAGAVVLLTYFAGQYHGLFFFFVSVGLAMSVLGASLFFGGRGLNSALLVVW